MNLSKLQEIVRNREPWRATVRGVVKSEKGWSDWTTTIKGVTFLKWYNSHLAYFFNIASLNVIRKINPILYTILSHSKVQIQVWPPTLISVVMWCHTSHLSHSASGWQIEKIQYTFRNAQLHNVQPSPLLLIVILTWPALKKPDLTLED